MSRLALLLALLAAAPTATALDVTVRAGRAVPVGGTPVGAEATVSGAGGPVELRAWLGGQDWQASRTWNGTAFQRSDRYALTVEPGPEGTWTGRVWVRANPDSANADELDDGRAAIGVRARAGGDRAAATTRVHPLEADETGWAAAAPGRPVEVREGGELVARLGAPGGAGPVRVPEPGPERRVCGPDGCQAGGWRLTRANATHARLAPAGEGNASPTAVLAADGRACAARLPRQPAGPVTLRRAELEAAGRCRGTPEDPSVARLWVRGREASRVPERPGRGQVAWDPVREGWAPWRLPAGVDPEPAGTIPVDGRGLAFATEEAGLERLRSALGRARHRVTATTYLLTSPAAAEALAEPARRGVDVHLYLEPDPVGGTPEETRRLAEWLEGQGVRVHRPEDPSEAGLLHAKVVVVDSSLALVLTENLTPTGLPEDGDGNLGVGIGVANASLARRVEALFRQPGPAREIRPPDWPRLEAPVQVVTAPENAWRPGLVPAWIEDREGPLRGAVLRANPRWGPRENPWLAALANHSRRHPVEVVLSGAPEGAARSNREALAHLEAHPRAGNLSARLSDPREGTVHAKALAGPGGGLVGSSNWGLGGAVLNREVNLLVRDPRLGDEVAAILADGASPGEPLPAPGGDLAALGLALAGAAVIRRGLSGRRSR